MSVNDLTREELITLLAWQVGCGADEAIADHPVSDQPFERLETFLSKTAARPPANTMAPASTMAPANTMAAADAPAQLHPLTSTLPAEIPPASISPGFTDESSRLNAIKSLPDLRSALEQLEGCALKHTASNMVFCDGNPGARVMVVGEAPGRDEDRVGLPFVGAAGQLLDKMLASIGLNRSTVYITNLLPWRPPGNRTPTAEETQLLLPYLRRHIQLANPDVIFILGGSSAKALLQTKDGILKVRGVWRDVDYGDGVARPTLASLHPAYLLRSPAQKRLSFDDLLSLRARLA